MAKFLVVYAWTQVPIALVEGVLTSVAHRHLTSAAAADQHEAV
jgi:ABC-type Co2+ transport system permease subunit